MITVNCGECGKSFEAQRKSAKFCSTLCRVKWNKKPPVVGSVSLPPDYVNVKKIGIIKADGTVSELDATKVPQGVWKTAILAMLDLSQNKPLPAPENKKEVMFAKPKKKGFFSLPKTVEENISYIAPLEDAYDKGKLDKITGDEPPMYPKIEENTVPKTLEELKRLCPAELTGLDRTIWINEQRKKLCI